MKKVIVFLACLGLPFLCFAIKRSSEMPEKREFPLSTKFKPCDNFHKYVCDEVQTSFELRDDRSRHSFAFSDSSERILEAKKKFYPDLSKLKIII